MDKPTVTFKMYDPFDAPPREPGSLVTSLNDAYREILRVALHQGDPGRLWWTRTHPNPFPTMVLFPRVERARRVLVEARARVAGAVDVLRHGVHECEADW